MYIIVIVPTVKTKTTDQDCTQHQYSSLHKVDSSGHLSSRDIDELMKHRPANGLAARRSRHAAVVTIVIIEVNRK